MSDKIVGYISGNLKLDVDGGGTASLGAVRLPLISTRVSPEKAPYMHFGVGVDLESVRDTIQEIFKQNEVTDER